MKIYNRITDLVGGTPLVELKNYEKEQALSASLLAKVEFFQPRRERQGPYCTGHD